MDISRKNRLNDSPFSQTQQDRCGFVGGKCVPQVHLAEVLQYRPKLSLLEI